MVFVSETEGFVSETEGSFTSVALFLLVNLARRSCIEVPLATSSNSSRRAASYSS